LNSILVYDAVLKNYSKPKSLGASKGIKPRQKVHMGEAFCHKS
jgi:hypothetical protein